MTNKALTAPQEIAAAIRLLKAHGYSVSEPPPESEYQKAIRTGVRPKIWPPIVMTRDDLYDFRKTHGLA